MFTIISFFQKLIKGGGGWNKSGGLENVSKINKRGGGRLFGTREYAANALTRLVIYQSKNNLDVKFLFGNITHFIDPEIKKMLERVLYGNQDYTFHFSPRDLPAIELTLHF